MGPYSGRWKGFKGHGDTTLSRNAQRSCRTRLVPEGAHCYQRASPVPADRMLPGLPGCLACTCAPSAHPQPGLLHLSDLLQRSQGAYVRTPCCLHFSATRTMSLITSFHYTTPSLRNSVITTQKGKVRAQGFPWSQG